MKKTSTKKVDKKKSKPKVIRVEHNGIVTYKAAPRESHMTKKSRMVLVGVLCGVAVLLAILGVVIMLVTHSKK